MGKSTSKQARDILGTGASSLTETQKTLAERSLPQLKQVGDYYSSTIKGGPELQKMVAPQVESTRAEFAKARENLANYIPRGGALERGYRDLAVGEAANVGSIYTGGIKDALAQLANLGMYGTGAGISAGTGSISAGSALANLAGQQAAAWGSGMGGVASGLGTLFGLKMAG